MVERHHIRYFLAVVDTGTFSRAAQLHRVSQPTVSAAIARLEELVGHPLFNRNSRRVELTTAGSRLVEHARRIESEFWEADRAFTEVPSASLIRIGIASTIAPRAIEAVVRACQAQDGITLEIVERRANEMRTLLSRGRIDLILSPVEANASGSIVELFRENFELVMAASHRLAKRETLVCEDLVGEPMLVRKQCESLSLISQFFTARGIRPFMAARSTSEERVCAYVRAGLGLTVMPRSLIQDGIVARPLAGLEIQRTIGLILEPFGNGRVERSGIVDVIVDAVRGSLAAHPDL